MRAARVDELNTESAISLALLDRGAAIRQAVEAVPEKLDVTFGFAAMVIDQRDTLQIYATSGAWNMGDIAIPAGQGLGGRVAALRRPVVVDDYGSSAEISHEFDEPILGQGIRALAAAPISHGRQFLGVLYAAERGPGAIGPRQVRALARLARQLGMALVVADRARDMADSAVHEDRRRMAHALHDSLGAGLFSIGAALRSLRSCLPDDPPIAARLAEIEEEASRVAATVRRTLFALDEAPREMALSVALQSDCRAFTERTGMEARALLLGAVPVLGPTQNRELVLMVREALVNIEKHAQARSVIVSTYTSDGGVNVIVTDDGVGPPPRRPMAVHAGLGLVTAHERLARLGGRLEIREADGGGCAVHGWIPC